MLERNQVKVFYKKLPRPRLVQLFRMNEDTVEFSKDVPYSQVRAMSVQEAAAIFGPTVTKAREINLFTDELKGVVPRQYDRLYVDGEYWFIDLITLEMMDTRYRCMCKESSPVT